MKQSDLATVRADHLRHVAAGDKIAFGEPAEGGFGGWAIILPFDLPFARTEYYLAEGVRWTSLFEETVQSEEFPFPEPVSAAIGPPRVLRAGSNTTERWNQAAFGPTLSNPPFPELWASRFGDTLIVVPPFYSDAAGREGFSRTDSERTVVSRDGTVIMDEPFLGAFVDVPPEAATYEVAMRAERGAPFNLSTVMEATWTFRSSHVDGDLPRRLPLSVVRFSPIVDRTNTAVAGQTALVPLIVSTQPDSGARPVASLSVEVSYDDGATWRRATVINLFGHRFLVLQHPNVTGFVSLRTRLEDTNHNLVEQTVIHAYRIAPRG